MRSSNLSTKASKSNARAANTARAGLKIQKDLEKKESKSKKPQSKKAKAKIAPKKYPEKMPAQHLDKPGLEADLKMKPQYMAPHYLGSEKLKGKVALITGADSGIGRAVAVLYAREGADVAILYLNEHKDAEETKKAIEAEGQKCILIPGDVTDPKFCQEAVEQTVNKFGHLDILVNNAAYQLHVKSIEDLTIEHWDLTFKTNIYGYFYMIKAALPHLKAGAVILNSGSVTGFQGSKELLDYSATKGAIHAFTKSLSEHLLDRGIRVNAVAPGPVWTPLNPADKNEDEIQEFGQQTSMGRAAQPEEIAPSYVFLAAPSCSSYITGEILPVVGGAQG